MVFQLMRAGTLDRRVVVQRFTASSSPSGELVEAWSAIGPARWASKRPVSGDERFAAQQLLAKEQVEFQLRWADDLADMQPTDRIIEPASDAAGPIDERSIYDIIGVFEIGRRDGLRVLTVRFAGTSTMGAAVSVIAPATGSSVGAGSGGS
jgi:head-tail adaptor